MTRSAPRWKRFAAFLRRTPLHPQWLYREPRMDLPEVQWLPNPGWLLDIGAGEGWLRASLAPGWHYVAFDHPEVGRTWYGARPDVCGDAAALPFGDASFDAVALLEVVEHLERFDLALAEVDRVLRPGGVLLYSVPFLYPVHDAPRDFQRMTIHGLRELAKRFGWEVLSERRLASGFRSIAVQFGVGLSAAVLSQASTSAYRKLLSIALLPLVPVVNLFFAVIAALLPDVPSLAGGHVVVYRKSRPEAMP